MSTGLNELISRTITIPQTTILGPATDGASAEIYIGDLTGPTGPDVLVIYGASGTGTNKVQVSNDKTNWFDVGADVTATIKRSLATDFMYVRVKCTVNMATAGSTATVVGRKAWRQS